MTKLAINPSTEKIIDAIINDLPQSLLISGEKGVGTGTIGLFLAKKLGIRPTVILPEKDEKVDIEKGIINVDIMRRLYDEVRTKTTGKRIIIIDFAERMTHQAQNAFLKLLEEPNDDTYFFLTSNSTSAFLPTIMSRVSELKIKPITREQTDEFIDSLGVNDKVKKSQLLFMANGLPAELVRLISDEKYFNEKSTIIRDARELLVGNLYKKLVVIQKYKDNRLGALSLLNDGLSILKRSNDDNPQIETINRIDSVIKTYKKIEDNGNIRLCLAQMVI